MLRFLTGAFLSILVLPLISAQQLTPESVSGGVVPYVSLFGVTRFPNVSNSQLSIGQLMVEIPPVHSTMRNDLVPAPCLGDVTNVDVSAPHAFSRCALASNVYAARWLAYETTGKPRTAVYTRFFGRTHSSTICDPTTKVCYTFVLPATICAERVGGNFEDPVTGDIEHNATLSSVYQSLAVLDPDHLLNYTTTVLEKAIAKLEAALEPAICDFPTRGGRTLLWYNFRRVTAQSVNGWTFKILSLAVTGALAFIANAGPVANVGPTAHASGGVRLTVLVLTIVLLAALGSLSKWLQDTGRTNVYEAALFNFVIIIAEYVTNLILIPPINACFPQLQIGQEAEAVAQGGAIPLAPPGAAVAQDDDACDFIGLAGMVIVK